MAEISTKPYLIRAIYEWCNDNRFTPYLAVMVDERTQVPREYVRNGEIVLNVSPMATTRLSLGNDLIVFQARFGGVARELSIPVDNVSAIYARENGHGMAFDVPKAVPVPTADAEQTADTGADQPDERPEERPAAPVLALAPAAPEPTGNARPDADPEPPQTDGGGRGKARSGKPRLTRIK